MAFAVTTACLLVEWSALVFSHSFDAFMSQFSQFFHFIRVDMWMEKNEINYWHFLENYENRRQYIYTNTETQHKAIAIWEEIIWSNEMEKMWAKNNFCLEFKICIFRIEILKLMAADRSKEKE